MTIMFPTRIQKLIHDKSFDTALRARLDEWAHSPNFVQFVNENEDKIYDKLKSKPNDEDKRDIGIELYIAFAFSHINCHVIYEPKVPLIPRDPDFKISFGDNFFYLEVRRLRKYNPKLEDIRISKTTGDRTYSIDNEKIFKKCGDIICEKIGQTVPDAINLLYIRSYTLADAPNRWDLDVAVKNLMEWKDEDTHGFEEKIRHYKINSISEFDRYWKQLSAMVISRPTGLESQIWENPVALQPINQSIRVKIREATKLPFRYDLCDHENGSILPWKKQNAEQGKCTRTV